MTSDSGGAHPADSTSGPVGCPRYHEIPNSSVLRDTDEKFLALGNDGHLEPLLGGVWVVHTRRGPTQQDSYSSRTAPCPCRRPPQTMTGPCLVVPGSSNVHQGKTADFFIPKKAPKRYEKPLFIKKNLIIYPVEMLHTFFNTSRTLSAVQRNVCSESCGTRAHCHRS